MSIYTKVYPFIEHVVTQYGEYDRTDRTATPTIDETFAGATLCDRELNYYDDSDGYSHVWDGETVRRIGTWTTRGGHDHAGCKVDAYDSPLTPAIRQWHINELMIRCRAARSRAFDDDEREMRRPIKGRKVRVIKGRKVPIGTEGTVIWVGPGYSKPWESRPANRIGVKDADGNVHWTSETNVEVVNPQRPDPDDYPTDADFLASLEAKDTRTLHTMYDQATTSLTFLR